MHLARVSRLLLTSFPSQSIYGKIPLLERAPNNAPQTTRRPNSAPRGVLLGSRITDSLDGVSVIGHLGGSLPMAVRLLDCLHTLLTAQDCSILTETCQAAILAIPESATHPDATMDELPRAACIPSGWPSRCQGAFGTCTLHCVVTYSGTLFLYLYTSQKQKRFTSSARRPEHPTTHQTSLRRFLTPWAGIWHAPSQRRARLGP